METLQLKHVDCETMLKSNCSFNNFTTLLWYLIMILASCSHLATIVLDSHLLVSFIRISPRKMINCYHTQQSNLILPLEITYKIHLTI